MTDKGGGGDDSDSDGEYDAGFIPKKKCKDIRGCADLYIYLKQNPRTAVAVMMFTSSFILLLFLGVAYAVDFHPNSCYFVAGIGGVISNVYGATHFRTLMSLKKEVDTYSSNNKKFAEENGQLAGEVNRFSQAKNELSDTQKRIRGAIKRQSENLGKFRELNKNLEATGKQNLELLKNLNGMANKMETKWRDELVKKERKILHVCFDRFEWEDGADGISREQFTQFKMTLPMEYQLRLTRAGDWKEIAGDDGILQLEEFVQLLDNFADEVAMSKHEHNMSTAGDIDKDELKKITNDTDDYKDGEGD